MCPSSHIQYVLFVITTTAKAPHYYINNIMYTVVTDAFNVAQAHVPAP